MNLVILPTCVFLLALGLSSAALTCYQCSGKDADCPKTASDAQVSSFDKVECLSTLSTVCAKYSIDLLNGDSYTYRSCEPTYVGGTAAAGSEFCTFIKSLYGPLVTEGLIASADCNTCGSIECNT